MVDFIWLGFVAKSFYRKEIGPLMLEKFKLLPAAIFYLAYPLALTLLAIEPAALAANKVGQAAFAAAVLGVMSYATYNLTNMSVLKGWKWKVVIIDTVWGTFATALTAVIVMFLTT